MKKDAVLRIATDWSDYAKWIIVQINSYKKFEWLAESKDDWERIPEDHIITKYQRKAIAEKRRSVFLEFRKN